MAKWFLIFDCVCLRHGGKLWLTPLVRAAHLRRKKGEEGEEESDGTRQRAQWDAFGSRTEFCGVFRMTDSCQHPVYLECAALPAERRKKVEKYFHIRRLSGGGECSPLTEVGDKVYRIAFVEREGKRSENKPSARLKTDHCTRVQGKWKYVCPQGAAPRSVMFSFTFCCWFILGGMRRRNSRNLLQTTDSQRCIFLNDWATFY